MLKILTEVCWCLEINVFKQYIINVTWGGSVLGV